MNNYFSKWSEITSGIPQGSILGPLLFNIYINDIFFFVHEDWVTNYADDTTPVAIKKNFVELIDALQRDSQTLLDWLNINHFKLNADKCKLLASNKDDDLSIDIDGETIICQKSVKLIGVTIDNQLNFSEHISGICKKVSFKLHALARVSHIMNPDKLTLDGALYRVSILILFLNLDVSQSDAQ